MSPALRKEIAGFQEGKGLKELNDELKKISPTMTAEVDIDSVKALTGQIKWNSRETFDAPIAVFKHFTGTKSVLTAVWKAFAKVGSNSLGKEALAEEVHKVIIRVVQDDAQNGSFDYKYTVEKKDKEMHILVGRDWPSAAQEMNFNMPGEDSLAKLIENLL